MICMEHLCANLVELNNNDNDDNNNNDNNNRNHNNNNKRSKKEKRLEDYEEKVLHGQYIYEAD